MRKYGCIQQLVLVAIMHLLGSRAQEDPEDKVILLIFNNLTRYSVKVEWNHYSSGASGNLGTLAPGQETSDYVLIEKVWKATASDYPDVKFLVGCKAVYNPDGSENEKTLFIELDHDD